MRRIFDLGLDRTSSHRCFSSFFFFDEKITVFCHLVKREDFIFDLLNYSFCFLLAVDGEWSGWGSWSSCSPRCGKGVQKRIRTCDSPAPINGGAPCAGSPVQKKPCSNECPGKFGWLSIYTWHGPPLTNLIEPQHSSTHTHCEISSCSLNYAIQAIHSAYRAASRAACLVGYCKLDAGGSRECFYHLGIHYMPLPSY